MRKICYDAGMMRRYQALAMVAVAALMVLGSGCAPRGRTGIDDYGTVSDRWVTPQTEDDLPIWGAQGGVVVGIYPSRISFGNTLGGPRGLFRIGYEKNGELYFVNYMAVNPIVVVNGRQTHNGSELLRSPDDGKKGIQFFAYPVDYLKHPERYKRTPSHHLAAEVVKRNGRRVLTWGVKTERFPKGQEAFFIFRVDEKRPWEFEVECHLLRGRKGVKNLMLSSTFGNITRLRKAYLSGKTVNSKTLYKGFDGKGFAGPTYWKGKELKRDDRGDLLFIAAPDEARPWETSPYPHPTKLLQYYRKKKGSWGSELRAMVNGRARFWATYDKIPGGVSYENLAILEDFDQGQRFSYGIYKGSVGDLLDGKRPNF
jgi:hypothetical protein